MMCQVLDTNPGVMWDDVKGLEYAKKTMQEVLR